MLILAGLHVMRHELQGEVEVCSWSSNLQNQGKAKKNYGTDYMWQTASNLQSFAFPSQT